MNILLLILGFSLIVLVHELGHFLAAKYVGIRVEQFALGFGNAVFAWRKGLGLRLGSTEKEYNRRISEGADPASMGETEYRWNWIPLGGYVKMMGQDDTKPGLVVNNPQSYTAKSVGARMLVISAGVIMNVIFAGIAFMVLFMIGLNVPQAVIGGITPMAPAQFARSADNKPAPLQVGDRIISMDGQTLHNDFRKVALNTALSEMGQPMALEVQRAGGQVEKVFVTPQQMNMGAVKLLGIGVSSPRLLEGMELASADDRELFKTLPAEIRKLGEGDRITQIAGQDVRPEDYRNFYDALQASDGRPVDVTIVGRDGNARHEQIQPTFAAPATSKGLNFAGMLPRVVIESVSQKSNLHGKAKSGDVVLSLSVAGDVVHDPTPQDFQDRILKAGKQGAATQITVLRGEERLTFEDVVPNVRLTDGFGLGVGIETEEARAVVAGTLEDSSAAMIPAGAALRKINDVAVESWYDVVREMRKAEAGKPMTVLATEASGTESTYQVALKPDELTFLQNLRYETRLAFKEMTSARTTSNPLTAAWWGVQETRDSILQVYLTLRRLFEGSVPLSGMMGPVGMVAVGAKVADQGMNYLLWFMAIISANLAVVNFLPVPVVDGGHFLFLIIEKIQGKPLSERTMVVAQYVGLALILTLFITVTYQDIMRMITL